MSTTASSLQGIGNLLTGFTRLSKALTLVLSVGFLITFLLPGSIRYLALVPGNFILSPWNIITSGYIEINPYTLVINALAVLFLGKALEPIWGSKEFFWFIVVVNTWTAICTFATMIILYASTRNEDFLYGPVSGFHGVVAALLVGVKQLMPDQEVTIFYVVKFRAKWVPSIFILLATILCAALGHAREFLPFIFFGTYISWIYLRFYQKKSESGLKGDPSDEFGFSTFFPEFLQPVVGPIATIFGRLFCGRRAVVQEGDDQGFLNKPLPGSDPAEASRRRERGARALEERLNATKGAETDLADISEAATLPTSTKAEESPV